MDISSKDKAKRVLINLFWLLVISFLSYKMPYYVDDYQHRLSFMDGKKIEHITQIFPSVAKYYVIWGGRAVSMFFIQLMLMLPRSVYAFCNGIIYVIVTNLIYSYALVGNGKKSKNTNVLSAIYLFLWFFMPDFGEVITWPTGTITYLWTNCIMFVFGLLYYKDFCNYEQTKAKKNIVLMSILYLALGFFSGQSNEAGASTLIFALFMFFVWKVKNKKKIFVEQIIGMISLLIGFVTLILAPGNFARTGAVADNSGNNSVIMNYAFRIGRESFYASMFLLIPFAIVIALYVFSRTNDESQRFNLIREIFIGKTCFFVLLAFVSVYVMTFSAGFANRIYQLPLLLLAIAMTISLEKLLTKELPARIRRGIAAFCITMMLMVMFEVTAGMLYAESRNSFYDRQTIYYHLYDTEGVLSGNGL